MASKEALVASLAKLIRAMEVPLSMGSLIPSVRDAYMGVWDELNLHGYPTEEDLTNILDERLTKRRKARNAPKT